MPHKKRLALDNWVTCTLFLHHLYFSQAFNWECNYLRVQAAEAKAKLRVGTVALLSKLAFWLSQDSLKPFLLWEAWEHSTSGLSGSHADGEMTQRGTNAGQAPSTLSAQEPKTTVLCWLCDFFILFYFFFFAFTHNLLLRNKGKHHIDANQG